MLDGKFPDDDDDADARVGGRYVGRAVERAVGRVVGPAMLSKNGKAAGEEGSVTERPPKRSSSINRILALSPSPSLFTPFNEEDEEEEKEEEKEEKEEGKEKMAIPDIFPPFSFSVCCWSVFI